MAANENGSSISISFSPDTNKKEESAMSPEASLEEGHVPPPSPNKISNSLKQRALSAVSKKYDIDGDGKLDEAEQAMRNLDTEGRGYLTNDKVLTVFQHELKMQKQLLLAKRLVIFFALLLVILAVANIGVAFAAARLSKDTTTQNNVRRRPKSRYCKRYYIYGTKRRSTRIANKNRKPYIYGPSIRAFMANQETTKNRFTPQRIAFDSDSFRISVDDCSSRTMSNNKRHFESISALDQGDPGYVNGPSGEAVPIKGKGTVKWRIKDDEGQVHTIRIPNSLYIPDMKQCLLLREWNVNQ